MKISLLLTGNELMSGDTVDSNSAYVAQSLKDLSLIPFIKKVVGDDLPLLVDSIEELAAVSDVLIINGGLGPTVDDLTALALSQATNVPIVRNQDALDRLEDWANQRDFMLTESNLKQTDLPANCEIIENPIGSAVGFRCLYQDCLIICTPGVPSEFKLMVEEQVLPLIKQHANITDTSHITRLRLFGISESGLQDIINQVFPDWPENLDLGFRVQMPVIEVKIASIGDQLIALNHAWTEKFITQFSDYIIGRDSTRLTQAVNDALLSKNKTLTLAESCTGGKIASSITSEAGSSAVFEAGYVAYSNKVKQSLLGVDEALLIEYGAVSKQVVMAMAEGALNISGSDIALAISGIAGPDGGTEEKPVGTVWIAWGEQGKIQARKFFFPGSRLMFQNFASAVSLDLIRRELLGLSTDVDYFSELKRKRLKELEK